MTTTQRVTSYNPQYNGKMLDKNLIREMHVVVLSDRSGVNTYRERGGMRDAITVRIHGTNAMNRVSVWVHGDGGCAGHGTAGGYGYHRPSAALQEALMSAGIKLVEPIDGAGDWAMESALLAIAEHLGYPNAIVVG